VTSCSHFECTGIVSRPHPCYSRRGEVLETSNAAAVAWASAMHSVRALYKSAAQETVAYMQQVAVQESIYTPWLHRLARPKHYIGTAFEDSNPRVLGCVNTSCFVIWIMPATNATLSFQLAAPGQDNVMKRRVACQYRFIWCK